MVSDQFIWPSLLNTMEHLKLPLRKIFEFARLIRTCIDALFQRNLPMSGLMKLLG